MEDHCCCWGYRCGSSCKRCYTACSSSFSSSLDVAIQWNAKGVTYMTRGAYEKAIESFRLGLDTMVDMGTASTATTTTTTATMNINNNSWEGASSSASSSSCLIMEDDQVKDEDNDDDGFWDFGTVPIVAPRTNHHSENNNNNGCAVFEECFSIFPKQKHQQHHNRTSNDCCKHKTRRTSRITNSSRSHMDLLTATLLYNMALAYQLLGLDTNTTVGEYNSSSSSSSKRSSLLAMAMRIHDVAVQTLLNMPLSLSVSSLSQSDTTSTTTTTTTTTTSRTSLADNDDSLALLLATSNNMAALCLEVYDYEAFVTCQRRMACILADPQRCYPPFFAGNYTMTCTVQARPASAA